MYQNGRWSSMEATITIPLDPTTRERLVELSRHRACSQAELAGQVLREYLDLQTWQLEAIEKGIEAADQGRLIDHCAASLGNGIL